MALLWPVLVPSPLPTEPLVAYFQPNPSSHLLLPALSNTRMKANISHTPAFTAEIQARKGPGPCHRQCVAHEPTFHGGRFALVTPFFFSTHYTPGPSGTSQVLLSITEARSPAPQEILERSCDLRKVVWQSQDSTQCSQGQHCPKRVPCKCLLSGHPEYPGQQVSLPDPGGRLHHTQRQPQL